jgi:uridine phosphorylase
MSCIKRMGEPLNRTLDHDEGLIRPMKGKADPDLGPDVVMAMIPSDLDLLAETSQAQKIEHSHKALYDVYRMQDGSAGSFALSGPFLGAPHAVMGMEKLIALGAQRIWVLGWCGSLQPGLCIGDLVLPTDALSEEGTSQHYPVAEKIPRADEALCQMLDDALKRKEQPFVRGTVWTTDAPYRETPTKVKAYQEQGILAVEMEMSALMTLAIYRGVRLSGLLVVSDELFDLKWHSGFKNPRLRKSSRVAAKILLDLVKST